MIEPSVKTIGDNSYLFRPLTATPAYKLLVKLVKMAGPSFAAMASEGTDKFALAANVLAQNLDERITEDIIKQLVQQSEVNGQALKLVFEMHFQTKIGELFQFLAFALEAQFGDFIGAVLSAQKSVVRSTATTSTTQMQTA